MSDQADLRRLAMTLPEVHEDVHRRRPAFRVGQRIFAMLGVAGNEALFARLNAVEVAVLKLDRDDQINMMSAFDGAVTPTEFYGHHGWTYLRLCELDEAHVTLLVGLAWRHVAPKRLLKPAPLA